MANTYTAIASVTVGSGGAATISFTSIPNTYSDLTLVCSLRSTTTGQSDDRGAVVTFNSSGTNYSARRLYAYNGTTTGSDSSSGLSIIYGGTTGTANTFSSNFIYIPNYTSSSNKPASADDVSEQNSATRNWIGSYAWLWSNSAAINSITLTPDAGSFAQYSTATLYGIKNSQEKQWRK